MEKGNPTTKSMCRIQRAILLFAFVGAVLPAILYGQSVVIDDLIYEAIDDTHASVGVSDCNNISGDVVIRETVEIESKTYIVSTVSLFFNFYTSIYIKRLSIPKTITHIEPGAFSYADLEQFIVDPENEIYRSIDGILYTKDGKTLCIFPRCYPSACVTIPEGVEEVQSLAFNHTWIEYLKFPETMKKINWDAFSNMDNLQTIDFSNSIDDISNTSFDGSNRQLKIIIMRGENLLNNHDYFSEDQLEKLTLFVPQETSATWQENPFWGKCKQIKELDGDSISMMDMITFHIRGENSVSISVTDGYQNLLIGDITIPESVMIDGKQYNVTRVEEQGFRDCKQLTALILPETVTYIDCIAFYMCENLREFYLPKDADWCWSAVDECNKLERYIVAEGNANYKSVDGAMVFLNPPYRCDYPPMKADESFEVPDGVEEFIMSNNDNIKNVKLPNTLKNYNIVNCPQLEVLDLPPSLEYLGNLSQCPSIKSLIVRKGNPVQPEFDFSLLTVFEESLFSSCTVYVPRGRSEYYKAALYWENFQHIEEMDMPDIYIDPSPFKNLLRNQVIVGYYTQDGSFEGARREHFGGKESGVYKACLRFTDKQMKAFEGNRITHVRFSLNDSGIDDLKVWISRSLNGEYDYCQVIEKPVAGWNEVKLDKPFDINGDTLFIGYEFSQSGGKYPIAACYEEAETGLFYLSVPQGEEGKVSWEDYGIKTRKLCLQTIIEGDSLPSNDLSTVYLDPEQNFFTMSDGLIIAWWKVRSWGRSYFPENYSISYFIDGQKEDSLDVLALPLWFFLPDLERGSHTLTVAVESINGMEPVYTADDTISVPFYVYEEDMGRQKYLCEFYNATWCPHSALVQYEILETMRERGDIALVNIHCDDGLSCDAADAYCRDLEVVPIAGYNRSAGLYYAEREPAFATVNISATFNRESGKLDVTVSGKCNEDYRLITADGKLTVLLTEDDVVMPQYSNEEGRYIFNYKHQGVLRSNISAIWGDELNWSDNKYEMNYSIKIDNTWNADKMKIVAFIGTSDIIVNCNDMSLEGIVPVNVIDISTDIRDYDEIYTVGGLKISDFTTPEQLPRGLFISNGKIIFKK